MNYHLQLLSSSPLAHKGLKLPCLLYREKQGCVYSFQGRITGIIDKFKINSHLDQDHCIVSDKMDHTEHKLLYGLLIDYHSRTAKEECNLQMESA